MPPKTWGSKSFANERWVSGSLYRWQQIYRFSRHTRQPDLGITKNPDWASTSQSDKWLIAKRLPPESWSARPYHVILSSHLRFQLLPTSIYGKCEWELHIHVSVPVFSMPAQTHCKCYYLLFRFEKSISTFCERGITYGRIKPHIQKENQIFFTHSHEELNKIPAMTVSSFDSFSNQYRIWWIIVETSPPLGVTFTQLILLAFTFITSKLQLSLLPSDPSKCSAQLQRKSIHSSCLYLILFYSQEDTRNMQTCCISRV